MSHLAPVEIVSLGAIACRSVAWLRAGELQATVVVKATFRLLHQQDAQWLPSDEIVVADQHLDNDRQKSLLRATETVPFLPDAGVVLIGHARPPAGKPASASSARLSLFRDGPVFEKTVHVFGDRSASDPSKPQPFQSMPLRYERTVRSEDNPVGVPHSQNLVDPGDVARAACFGPIAPSWRPRLSALAGLDARAINNPLPATPSGFDFAYFHAAPKDQRVPYLRGDEWVVLDGMHPHLGRVQSRLPSVAAAMRAVGLDKGVTELSPVADQLVIDADRQTCSLVWRATFPLPRDLGDVTVFAGVQNPEHAIVWPKEAEIGMPVSSGPVIRENVPEPAPMSVSRPAVAATSPKAKPAPLGPLDDNDEEDAGASFTMAIDQLELARAAMPFMHEEANPTTDRREKAAAVPATPWDYNGQPPPPATPAPTIEDADTTMSLRAEDVQKHLSKIRPGAVPPPTVKPQPAAPPPAPVPPPPAAVAKPPPVHASTGSSMPPAEEDPGPASITSDGPALPASASTPFEPPPPAAPPPSRSEETPAAGRDDHDAGAAAPHGSATPDDTLRGLVLEKLAAGNALYDLSVSNADLRGIDFAGKALGGCDLRDCNLEGCSFDGCRLSDVKLAGANLTKASFVDADFSRSDLRRANVTGASFQGAGFQATDLSQVRASGASFEGARAKGVSFVQAELDRTNFVGADVSGADFSKTKLDHAQFDEANATETQFSDAVGHSVSMRKAVLVRARLVAASLSGVIADDADAEGSTWERAQAEAGSFQRVNLNGANLGRVELRGAVLADVDMTRALLRNAMLDGANLTGATLRDTDLRQASVQDAVLRSACLESTNGQRANLSGADLTEADLSKATMRGAKMKKVRLTDANVKDADMRDADLEGANLAGVDQSSARLNGAKLKDVVLDPPAS